MFYLLSLPSIGIKEDFPNTDDLARTLRHTQELHPRNIFNPNYFLYTHRNSTRFPTKQGIQSDHSYVQI